MKIIPKSAKWPNLSGPFCFRFLSEVYETELGRAIDRDGSVLDLKAFKETKDGVVFAEIIVNYTDLG